MHVKTRSKSLELIPCGDQYQPLNSVIINSNTSNENSCSLRRSTSDRKLQTSSPSTSNVGPQRASYRSC